MITAGLPVNRGRFRGLALLPAMCLVLGGATPAATAGKLGPFLPQPVVAVYLVADGEPCSVRISVKHRGRPALPRFLIRVFDPDERLALWRYVEYADAATVQQVQAHEGIQLRVSDGQMPEGAVLLEAPLELSAAGVYQVRVSNASREVSLELEAERELPYGVCFQNGDFQPWPGQPRALHAYIPPHAEELHLRGGPVLVRDDLGQVRARHTKLAGDDSELEVERTGVVWQLEFPDAQNWSLRAAGLPLVLCPTAEAARAIRASVEVLPDGTVVCHKFQRRVAQLLPAILSAGRVGDTEHLITPLADRKDAWLADPLRNLVLTRSFLPAIEHWLRTQNLDPTSHWGGSLDGWQDKINAEPPENRWDRLKGVTGLWAGASSHYGAGAEHLALAATHDSPANPYFGKQELLFRAAAAALRDLMVLQEDETWPGIADLDPYPGGMAFPLGQKTLPVFGRAAPHLPAEIREVWTDGLRRIVDRSYPDNLVSCRNQSSHYLVAFQAFADGCGQERYQDLARLYGRRFARGQHRSGYHMEATGPDASYIGMTHWHEAVYYRMSGDPVILESMRRSYDLFNHTVAPEPDGRMLGGFNFNHRVEEGFYFEQWGGAKGILDDVLPQVGVWAGPPKTPEEQQAERAKALETLTSFLQEPKRPSYPDQTTWRYLYFREPDRTGTFPCLAEQPFIRTFGGEFLAVKRPGYYAICYLGKPAGEWYIRAKEDLRLPYPDDAESTGDELPPHSKIRITPFAGGGLSGFWTPAYGHALMAANWSPTTHHGLVATRQDGKRYWEDYHAHEHQLDAERGELTFAGRIEAHPISYQRTYTFGDEALTVRVKLTAEQDVALAGLVENIPLARGGWKAQGADIVAAGRHEGQVTADSFRVLDRTGAGVEVKLEHARPLKLVPEGLKTSGWRQLQIGRVEIILPSKLRPGTTLDLTYDLRAITPR